jgi:alkanesulfonate monooxygenase SsuD/methylene tetrahydromethanopterin reductase-like flavin-dependent oxidoreductase (luciferase family)
VRRASWRGHGPAEAGPFASVGVLDRVAYRSLDAFPVLGAAGAATSRLRLVTMVAIGPIRSTALLAKQAASVDQVSGGRLTLGLALGARLEDYDYVGRDARAARRGLHRAARRACGTTSRTPTCAPPPVQTGGPPLLVGGLAGPALWRMARLADGYVHGGGPPRAFARAAAEARAAWTDAERPSTPELWGQGYFALGGDRRRGGRLRLPPRTTTRSPGRSPRRSRPATSPPRAPSATSSGATRTPGATT